MTKNSTESGPEIVGFKKLIIRGKNSIRTISGTTVIIH